MSISLAYLHVHMLSSSEETLRLALAASEVCTSLIPSGEQFGNGFHVHMCTQLENGLPEQQTAGYIVL